MTQPSLFLTPDEIDRARARVTEPRWKTAAESLRAEADKLLAEPPEMPAFDCAWFDADPGRDYVETYQLFTNYAMPAMRLSGTIQALLRAARVFDESRYAEPALAYAACIVDRFNFGVRHHDDGLSYSRIIPALAEAYLYFGDGLDIDDRDRWRGQLTAAGDAVCVSREHWATELAYMPYNNHLAHHQAALLTVGIVLGRDDWIDTGLNGRGGFAYLLPGCTRDDGLCYESSTLYHFGTLRGLVRSAELARHFPDLGRDLYHETFANGRTLKQMFDAPIGLMLPNGELPSLGDCYASRGPMWAHKRTMYELAYAVYGDPRYAWLLKKAGERDSIEALLYGADELGEATAPDARSRVWIEHGYALLTNRRGDAYWDTADRDGIAAVLTGDLSGIHSQRDSLSVIVAAAGWVWVEDIESAGVEENKFSDPIQKAFNKTVWSHNTVAVDEADQRRHDRPLPVIEFKDLPACHTVAMADPHGWLYPGVRMVRTIAVTDGYCLDLFQVASDTERTYDWLTHPRADSAATCEVDWADRTLPDRACYALLSKAAAAEVGAEGVGLQWSQEGEAFRADVSAGVAGELIRAEWPTVADGSGPTREMFLYRVRAERADFVAVYQVPRGDRLWRVDSIRRVFNGESHEVRVTVTDGQGTREHILKSV